MKISPRLAMLMAFMAKTRLEGRIQLKYEGPPNEIDADTLLRSLSGIIQAIGEISAETTKSRVDIKVTALKGASFDIFLLLTPETLSTLISAYGTPSIPTILRCLVDFLTLKKLLKGEKPAQVIERHDGIEVRNNEGLFIQMNDKSTLNLYLNHTKLNNSIESTYEVLQNDPAIKGFDIIGQSKKPLFQSKRNDFPGMAARNKALLGRKMRFYTDSTQVVIFKVILEPPRPWEVYYKGNKISVKIVDEAFWQKIDRHEISFGKGDILDVELEIEQELIDPVANIYENRTYQIKKVIQHFPRAKQGNLGL